MRLRVKEMRLGEMKDEMGDPDSHPAWESGDDSGDFVFSNDVEMPSTARGDCLTVKVLDPVKMLGSHFEMSFGNSKNGESVVRCSGADIAHGD
jgi:hypothetical protein